MKKCFFLFLLSLVLPAAFAQNVLNNNPPSIKWFQVSTPHFRVLFPAGFDAQAQRVANTLEQIYEPGSRTLGEAPRRLSVVLQNQSSISNAFVSISPRRSEFYTMPSQDYNFVGNNDWLDMIATHEYRHVVQYDHANQGLNRFLFYLFGNNTLSLLSNIAAPQWFWEGDAVATETAFTPTGRGSIPNFGLLFRTNLLEGRTFNYHKQYLRSYKHNIPNHYVLGYHMVSYLRKRTGDPMIWGKITERAWRRSLVPFTFSNAIKKETGLHVTDLYREMAADLQKTWRQSVDTLTLSAFNRVNPRTSGAYTDYLYPQVQHDGGILAMKSGIGNIEQLVTLDGGDEHKVWVQGAVNKSGMLSVAAGRAVWNEYNYHPRWRIKNYSVVKACDLATKKVWTVGPARSRFAGAALSPDGKKVVTARSSTDYRHALVVLDVDAGRVLKEYPNPENHFFSMARWSEDGKRIVALMTTGEGKAVVVLDAETGARETIIPPGDENIGHPVLHGRYLFYNSPVSGIDNIYAREIGSGQAYRVTNSRYGSYNPAVSPDGKVLYYNEQGRNGMDVVEVPLDPSTWRALPGGAPEGAATTGLDEVVIAQEDAKHLLATVPQQKFPVTKYAKARGLINPYSWGAYFDNTLTRADIGLSSQDVLSTMTLNAGYQYDITENTGFWHAGLSYQGFFPIIDVDVSYGKREEDEGTVELVRYNQQADRLDTLYRDLVFNWTETNAEVNVRIPLLLTRSKYQSSITIENAVGATRVTEFRNNLGSDGRLVQYDTSGRAYFFRDYVGQGTLLYNHFGITAFRHLKQSRRDINPRWGQTLYFDAYHTPYGGDFSGAQFSAYAVLYLPGLFRHHSLWGYGGYQHTEIPGELDDYTFRNRIPFPRGLSVSRFEHMYSLSANYAMPLWYPDIALGPLLNIQRIRTNVFFDYGYGSNQTSFREYASAGGEIRADFNIFRLLPQLNVGFRYAYGIKPSTTKYEVIIGTINF